MGARFSSSILEDGDRPIVTHGDPIV